MFVKQEKEEKINRTWLESWRLAGLILLWSLAPGSFAGSLPSFQVPEGVGVNIHFTTGHEADLDLIAAAGIRIVRMDFVWESIEKARGNYVWEAYDELLQNLEKRGLTALLILDYSNPLYERAATTTDPVSGKEREEIASPQNPESVAAFARWSGAAAKRYSGRKVIWEIWNEPNITFWKPKPDVQQYLQLALATAKEIRAANSNATIVAPATSEVPLEFLRACFQGGLLPSLDAVSVHPYRAYHLPPETAAADYTAVRDLIFQYAPAGKKNLPVISGEWGYASHTKGVPVETQAAFVVRQQLSNLLNRVPISVWYDWKNDGPDAEEREHNFGLVTADLKPKPAYTALQVFTRELSGYTFGRRVVTDNAADYVLTFRAPEQNLKVVAWTTGSPHTITIPLEDRRLKKITGLTGYGRYHLPRLEKGLLYLELDAMPKYFVYVK